MKCLLFLLCAIVFASQAVKGEECEYTMEKMCSLTPGATYRTMGCWYNCRIEAEFEVFAGTMLNGSSCKSPIGNDDGVCKQGLCIPNV